MPWYLGNHFSGSHLWGNAWFWSIPGFIILLALWSVVWTGLALWHAAKREEKVWFIVFLFIHTAGILELLYLIFVAHAFTSPRAPQVKRRKHS